MKDFKDGVRFYTVGTVSISFPEDDVCCWRCPLMGRDYDREVCRRTGELLAAPRSFIGARCPMRFEGGTENAEIS